MTMPAKKKVKTSQPTKRCGDQSNLAAAKSDLLLYQPLQAALCPSTARATNLSTATAHRDCMRELVAPLRMSAGTRLQFQPLPYPIP